MDDCEKMRMFIEEHSDVAFRFMIWEEEILPRFNNIEKNDRPTDISNIDFDIID